jgi:hypothetical protein
MEKEIENTFKADFFDMCKVVGMSKELHESDCRKSMGYSEYKKKIKDIEGKIFICANFLVNNGKPELATVNTAARDLGYSDYKERISS